VTDGTLGPPALAGFQLFILNNMGITAAILPPDSLVVATAFNLAQDIVNLQLQSCSPDIYTLAVYNLGGSNIINMAMDQPGAPIYMNNLPFFAYVRKSWNILGFAGGVIQSSSDVSTSESMVVQKAAEEFTLADIQLLKDPYGRTYLAYAQKWGSLWGSS
jgi:hypothetical protein